MKPFQDITDPSVAKALAHPLRSHILTALEGRTASPSQLASELDVPLGVLSYHVRRLSALGFLRLVRRVPRRGAVEHYYTVTDKPRISDQAWGAMPSTVKEAMLGASLSTLGVHIGEAAAAGGFDAPESRLSRQRFRLDEQGWREAAAELETCTRRLEELERQSEARLGPAPAAGGDPPRGHTSPGEPAPVGATVVMMLFEPPPEPPPA